MSASCELLNRFHENFPKCPYTYYTDFSERGEFCLYRASAESDIEIAGSRQGVIKRATLAGLSLWRYAEEELVANWLDIVERFNLVYN